MSPTVNDLEEVYDEFKRLFPEIEEDSERGRTIRSRLNDAMAKLALTRYGQEDGAKYAEAFRDDPLAGLRTFPGIANELLSNIIAHRIHEKRFPMVGVEDFQEWFLGHKEEV